jgi:hypothetical protein
MKTRTTMTTMTTGTSNCLGEGAYGAPDRIQAQNTREAAKLAIRPPASLADLHTRH